MTLFNKTSLRNNQSQFFVVGIGASAGGLEAIERFFRSVKPAEGLAYVVVQHLSPDFMSMMDELIGRYTSIPVHVVEEDMKIEPNNIYLIPPKKEMHLERGHFKLTEKEPNKGLSLPINVFFASLAEEVGEKAIGIILSGTGSDGSKGIEKIHEAGGLVFVQDKESAKFDGMPLSAIETGAVDQVLLPERIPEYLSLYRNNPKQFKKEFQKRSLETSNLEPTEKVLELFKNRYGIDFNSYKPNTIIRRLDRRLEISKFREIADYYSYLLENPDELNELYNDLLIGVTRFFRDPEAFELLAREVIPQIVKSKEGEEIRVWVAGCASGEEVYSIAILFYECAEQLSLPLKIKLFATDIHKVALETAAAGFFSIESLGKISPAIIEKYFTSEKEGYRIVGDIRKVVVFSAHNITRDPPFSKIDLITCRNLLIYIKSEMQKSIFSKFHFSLQPEGYLFLGPSESLGELEEAFDTIDNRWKIYKKIANKKLPISISLESKILKPALPTVDRMLRDPSGKILTRDNALMRAYDSILEEFIPAGFLVNENLDIIHIFSDAHSFMSITSGRLSYTLTDTISDELKAVIISSIQKIRKTGKAIRYEGVKLTRYEKTESFTLSLRLINSEQNEGLFFLIILELEEKSNENEAAIFSQDYEPDEVSRLRIQSLEAELKFTKENLQATIEELETCNEEVQATNEELVASNEELQSTNEELHSVNEELYSVNSEYQQKIGELTQITNDIENLISSTNIGTIFLDKNLCIRKFTPAITETFSLISADSGRPITHFAHNIETPDLVSDIKYVLNRNSMIEREVQTKLGAWYLMRILPYIEKKNSMNNGVVLSFVDIATIKKEQARVLEKQTELEAFTATAAHDLQAPLRRISGFSEVIKDLIDNQMLEEAKEKIENISRFANSGGELVNDLLSYSKMESSALEFSNVNLDNLVASLIEDAKVELNKVNGVIEVTQLPTLSGDKTSLFQLFHNMINNAIKYYREGEQPKISISVRKEGENYYHFTITDNGMGIPKDLLSDVFIPFRRVSNKTEGSGIGLAICKKVVERHKGKIWVESDLGKGSTFHFVLPQDPENNQVKNDLGYMLSPKAHLVDRKMTEEKIVDSEEIKIILVENEYDDIELFKLYLDKVEREISLEVFMSSGDFLTSSIQADIIFLDYDLRGDCSGLDIIKLLRGKEINYKGPVVLASSQVDKQLEDKFIREGGNSVLPKSKMTAQSLEQVLKEYIPCQI